MLEQFSHVHSMGAHGGQTRVFRHAYAEGADYVPFVLRADKLWTQLEAETGCKTLHRVGTLEFDTGMDSVGATTRSRNRDRSRRCLRLARRAR